MAIQNTRSLIRGSENRLARRAALYEALSRLSCGVGRMEDDDEARRRRAENCLKQAETRP